MKSFQKYVSLEWRDKGENGKMRLQKVERYKRKRFHNLNTFGGTIFWRTSD